MQHEGVEAFVDRLNFLLDLHDHALLYAFHNLNNGFLHPRVNVVEKGGHQASNFYTQARGTNVSDGGVDHDELGGGD